MALTAFSVAQSQELPRIFIDDDNNFTTTGNIGLTLSNFGTFGDGFVEQAPDDQPSCEYPRGSGIEHIFVGGLWVGAERSAGTRVSTGAFNIARLSGGGSANFEYTNTADPNDIILERSSIFENQFFSPEAISHQDFVIDFTDTNLFVPGTSIPIPNHEPLGVGVELESYAWNFPFADAFVILNYTISNVWPDTLENVYVGLWADLVVRNTNNLPPRVGGPFYQDVGVGFMDNDTAQLIYAFEHGTNNYSNGDSYVALVFLGASAPSGDQLYAEDVIHNWWLFSGGDDAWEEAPATESAKYERMRTSLSDDDYQTLRANMPANFMNLISTGPFERLAPGESVNVVFAVTCGKKAGNRPPSEDDALAREILIENVSWAQRAYHGEDANRNGILDFAGTDSTEDLNGNGTLDRYILPTPPSPPKLKVIPGDSRVTLMWDGTSEESIDLISRQKDFEGYRVYRSFLGGDLSETGIFDNMQKIQEYDLVNGLFYDTGLQSVLLDAPVVEITTNPATGLPDTAIYKYALEIENLHNGWQYAFAVSAFDSGDVALNLISLESSRLQNAKIVSPGTPPPAQSAPAEVGVYPNPYRVNALWDGGFERERKIFFYNLPAHSEVRIYTLAGDQVDSFVHDGNYTGADLEWYQNFSEGNTVFPGGEHAWDLVSHADQAIATGLYLYTVKDLQTGDIQRGKFVVIK